MWTAYCSTTYPQTSRAHRQPDHPAACPAIFRNRETFQTTVPLRRRLFASFDSEASLRYSVKQLVASGYRVLGQKMEVNGMSPCQHLFNSLSLVVTWLRVGMILTFSILTAQPKMVPWIPMCGRLRDGVEALT